MDPYTHIKVIFGLLLGLAIRHLLNGAIKLIQHPGRNKAYWVHLSWTFYMFLLMVHFWWWEFHLKDVTHWYFTQYFFLIVYIIVYYILCAILYPDDLKDYTGYKDYFYSRKKWFFGFLGASYLLDVIDTWIKGADYLHHYGIEYPIRNITHFILCMIAMQTNSRRYHSILAVLFIIYEIYYICRLFITE